MARRRGIMSEELKMEIARELGFADTVQNEGFGAVPSRQCGNMVKRAIEIAERAITPTMR
jgi:small acid-soluble spore protein F (minor alpha/beta-type SASP)